MKVIFFHFFHNFLINKIECDYKCQSCNTNSSNCLNCAGSNRLTDIPDCICDDGYFDDGSNSDCSICNYKCLTCINNALNCLSCNVT